MGDEHMEREWDRQVEAQNRLRARNVELVAERHRLAVEVLRVAVPAMDHSARFTYPQASADSMARNDVGNAVDDAVRECLGEAAYRAARAEVG